MVRDQCTAVRPATAFHGPRGGFAGTDPADGSTENGGSTKDAGAGSDESGEKTDEKTGGDEPAGAQEQPDSTKGGSGAATPDTANEPKNPDAAPGDGEDAPGS